MQDHGESALELWSHEITNLTFLNVQDITMFSFSVPPTLLSIAPKFHNNRTIETNKMFDFIFKQ